MGATKKLLLPKLLNNCPSACAVSLSIQSQPWFVALSRDNRQLIINPKSIFDSGTYNFTLVVSNQYGQNSTYPLGLTIRNKTKTIEYVEQASSTVLRLSSKDYPRATITKVSTTGLLSIRLKYDSNYAYQILTDKNLYLSM